MEITPGFIRNPDTYYVVLHPNGKLTFRGFGSDEHVGDWTAEFTKADFGKLADVANGLSFDALKSQYRVPMSDQWGAIVTVHRGKWSKAVNDYGRHGPAAVWAMERLIGTVVDGAYNWQKAKARKNSSPESTPNATARRDPGG